MLAETPKLKSLEVLRRLRERGYAGGKSAVYELVRQLRQQAVRPICRFEGLAGEFSQHDFGEVWIEWAGGQGAGGGSRGGKRAGSRFEVGPVRVRRPVES